MMVLNEIERKIVEQYKNLEGEASWEEIKDKTFAEAGLDSLDNIEGIMWAEDEFNITILNSEASSCVTFQKFANLIERKIEDELRRRSLSLQWQEQTES